MADLKLRLGFIMEIILASLSLGLMGFFVKLLHGQVSPLYVLWFRSLCHILFLAPWIFSRGFQIQLKRESVYRGICGFLGMGLYFFTLQKMPLVLATSIFWSAPLFTVVFRALKDKRSLPLDEGLSFVVIAVGIVLLQASSQVSVSVGVFALGLLSALFIGGSYYFLGALAQAKESALSITFSFSFLMFAFSTPFAIATPVTVSLPAITALIAVGISAVLYQYFITRVYQKNHLIQAASLQAVVIPLFSLFADQIFFSVPCNLMKFVAILFLVLGQVIRSPAIQSSVIKPLLRYKAA